MNSDSLGGIILKIGIWLVACFLLPWVVIPVTLIYFAFNDGRRVGRYEEQKRNNYPESRDGHESRAPIVSALEMVRDSHTPPGVAANNANVNAALSRLRLGIEDLHEEAGLGDTYDALNTTYVSDRILEMLENSDNPEELVDVILEETTADMVQEGLILDPGQRRLSELEVEPAPHGPPMVTESDDPRIILCMSALYAGQWTLYEAAGLDPTTAPQSSPKARMAVAQMLSECDDPDQVVKDVLGDLNRDLRAQGLIR